MSQDQEPSPKQRLRHALRDLHVALDDKAPRWMGTRARAAAILPLLTSIAGDTSLFGDHHDEPSPTPPTEPSGGASARRRTPAAGPESRRLARAAAGGAVARSVRDPEPTRDATGVELGESDAADEPAGPGWVDAVRNWFFDL